MGKKQQEYSSNHNSIFWSLDWRAALVLTGVGLGLLVLVGVLAWAGMKNVGETAARAWALVATLLLPVAGWAGYRLAHAEARGRLKGIDDALDKITTAAAQAIDLRVNHIVKTKEVMQPPQNVVVLPPPEFSYNMRPQLQADDVLELE